MTPSLPTSLSKPRVADWLPHRLQLPPRPAPAALASLRTLAERLRLNLAVQDWVLLGFHLYMCLRATFAPVGLLADVARPFMSGLFGAAVVVVVITRGEVVRERNVRVVLYRFGIFATSVLSYLGLRYHLAALDPQLLDAPLLELDHQLFGTTPAAALDRFVRPETVEWFAFFYYLHFLLVALHVIGGLVFDTGRRRYELLLGIVLVACIGHTVYTLVPGVGPYAAFPSLFEHPLQGGFFWRQVVHAVTAAGAQLDIFPSLHTAYPVFFTLHAIRHRARLPFRLTWLPTLFITANIVVATVFLRWHYGIDLVGGTLLAVAAQRMVVAVGPREEARVNEGGQAVWEPMTDRERALRHGLRAKQ